MKNANDIVDSSQFETNLREAIMEYSMLKHPFYVAWTEGRLSKEVLVRCQTVLRHVSRFPTYVSAVHSHCDEISVRQQLLENLIEKAWR